MIDSLGASGSGTLAVSRRVRTRTPSVGNSWTGILPLAGRLSSSSSGTGAEGLASTSSAGSAAEVCRPLSPEGELSRIGMRGGAGGRKAPVILSEPLETRWPPGTVSGSVLASAAVSASAASALVAAISAG